jgi:hypothetical protein
MMPVRFQQHRTKGWRKPNARAVCVSRSSRWGNKIDWRIHGKAEAVRLFRAALLGDQREAQRILGYAIHDVRVHLRGRDLGCYCKPDEPCHADVLLEVANA